MYINAIIFNILLYNDNTMDSDMSCRCFNKTLNNISQSRHHSSHPSKSIEFMIYPVHNTTNITMLLSYYVERVLLLMITWEANYVMLFPA